MKNLLTILILSLFTIGVYSQNNNYDRGYQEGYKQGYCYNKGIGCLAPLPPITPTPRINEDMNSYQDGYNRGFNDGLQAQKTESSNNPQDRKRYETAQPKFLNNFIYKSPYGGLSQNYGKTDWIYSLGLKIGYNYNTIKPSFTGGIFLEKYNYKINFGYTLEALYLNSGYYEITEIKKFSNDDITIDSTKNTSNENKYILNLLFRNDLYKGINIIYGGGFSIGGDAIKENYSINLSGGLQYYFNKYFFLEAKYTRLFFLGDEYKYVTTSSYKRTTVTRELNNNDIHFIFGLKF